MDSSTSPTIWLWASAVAIAMIVIDLLVFRRRGARTVPVSAAATWSLAWVFAAAAFAAVVYAYRGAGDAAAFATSYAVHKVVALENIFIFTAAFFAANLSRRTRDRILILGIAGAVLCRSTLVGWGVVVPHPVWLTYTIGGLLTGGGLVVLLTGSDHTFSASRPLDAESIPGSNGTNAGWDRVKAVIATIFLSALLTIGLGDVIFQVDSVPSVLVTPSTPLVHLTASLFAIVGLRTLYHLLAALMDEFAWVRTGFALIVLFVGIHIVAVELTTVPVGLAVGMVAIIVSTSLLVSLVQPSAFLPRPSTTSFQAVRRPAATETVQRS